MITKERKIPCEVDICMSSDSYKIDLPVQWLCKEHMQELLSHLQRVFDEISKEDIE